MKTWIGSEQNGRMYGEKYFAIELHLLPPPQQKIVSVNLIF